VELEFCIFVYVFIADFKVGASFQELNAD